jgi:type II secretory pathway pseudopilin PulG
MRAHQRCNPILCAQADGAGRQQARRLFRSAVLLPFPRPRTAGLGFTILEIMVGVGVVGLVLITMYRLVASQLQALQISREAQAQSAAMDGLASYLQGVLAGLPVRQADCLRGIPHVFGLAPADEIQWMGRPGLSLLTSAAPEADYAVTLTIQPSTTNSRQQELGIRRRLVTEVDSAYEWIRLLPDIAALEFRYFHPLIGPEGGWLERWEDANSRPALVRMKVWRRANEEPYEVVLPVPSHKIQ